MKGSTRVNARFINKRDMGFWACVGLDKGNGWVVFIYWIWIFGNILVRLVCKVYKPKDLFCKI